MWSRPVDAASDNTHYIRGLAFHSCGGAEILDLLRVLSDVVLNRAITAITTQGVDKSIFYVDTFCQ